MKVIWFVPPALAVLAETIESTDQVEGVATRSSDQQYEELIAGTSEAAVTSIDNVIAWNRRGATQDFRVIAQLERTTPLTLIAAPSVTNISDLIGYEILVDAVDNGFVVALRTLLMDAGLAAGSYRLSPVGGVRERLDGLRQGLGVVTLLGPPFTEIALAEGFRSLGTINAAYPTFPGQGLVVRRDKADRFGNGISDFLRRLESARDLLHRQGAQRVFVNVGAKLAEDTASQLVFAPTSLYPSIDGIALLTRQRRQLGLPGGGETYDSIVDDRHLLAIGAAQSDVLKGSVA